MKEEDKEYSIIDDNPYLDWTLDELRQEEKNIKKYKAGMRKALLNAQERSRKKEIKSLSKKVTIPALDRQDMTSSKLFMIIILVNCSIIEIYSMWAMYKLKNLEALPGLITAVIGESISYLIYCAKSYFGKKEEGRLNLDRDLNGLNDDSINDTSDDNSDTSDSDESSADDSTDENDSSSSDTSNS